PMFGQPYAADPFSAAMVPPLGFPSNQSVQNRLTSGCGFRLPARGGSGVPGGPETIKQQQADAYDNGTVGQVEGRPVPAEGVQVEKGEHGAEEATLDDDADGAADNAAQRNRQKPVERPPQPDRKPDQHRRRHADKLPAAHRAVLLEQAEADTGI